jgi:hypothetical protein
MKLNGWDHALKVTATGEGLVGHAGAILLRKAADVTGLTSLLSGALEEKGKSPLLDRGTVLVLTAAAIALGATSMSDVALLRHLAPLIEARCTTVQRFAPPEANGQAPLSVKTFRKRKEKRFWQTLYLHAALYLQDLPFIS